MVIVRSIAFCLCTATVIYSGPLEKTLEIAPAVVFKHMRVIAQLKERFASKIKKPSLYTPSTTQRGPTQAYLSLPNLKEAVDTAFSHATKRPEIAAIVKKVQDREQEFKDDYYVFYHGQLFEFRILQDIVKTLLQIVHLQGKNKHFVYLRVPTEFYTALTPETVAKKFENGATDSNGDLQKRLVSVNLSLFGNSYYTFGECTFDFFIRSSNIFPPPIKDEIHNFFSSYGFPLEFVNQVAELYNKYKTPEGNLIQIFIPKNKVDACAYLCKPFGRPYDQAIVHEHFNFEKQLHTKLGPVLEKYSNSPASISDLDGLQARLIITNDTLLNPNYGITMFRYSTMSKAKKQAYKAELKAIVEKLIITFINNNTFLGKNHPFEKLIRFIAKKTVFVSGAPTGPAPVKSFVHSDYSTVAMPKKPTPAPVPVTTTTPF